MSFKHGFCAGGKDSPEYRSWHAMVERCYNPKSIAYHKYGARGIYVCDRWRWSVVLFAEDMGKRPPGTTLDRIDNSKGYEPGNCRWATLREQGKNKRNAHFVTVNGETATVSEWARRIGVTDVAIHRRLRRGDSGAALIRPPGPRSSEKFETEASIDMALSNVDRWEVLGEDKPR